MPAVILNECNIVAKSNQTDKVLEMVPGQAAERAANKVTGTKYPQRHCFFTLHRVAFQGCRLTIRLTSANEASSTPSSSR